MKKVHTTRKQYLTRLMTFVFAFLSCYSVYSQTNVNIPGGGSGPAPGSGFTYRPLGTFWGYDRSEMQYSAAELTAAGVPNGIIISKVAFYLTGMNNPSPVTPVKVYLKEVGGPSGLVSNVYSATIAPATLCFNGSVTNGSLAINSWININLTSPFYFNGGGTHLEVIVETNFGGAGGENFNGKTFAYTNVGTPMFQYWSADNAAPLGNGIISTYRPDCQIAYTVATPCSSVPGVITTVASASSVCTNVPFSCSLTGLYPPYNSGYTFQWQYSTVGAGGPWTNIAGATQGIYVSAGQLVTTWYRCQVNCGASLNYSSPAQITMNSPTTCYCTSAATFSFDTDIGQVVFGPLTNPAVPGPTTNNPGSFNLYSDFTTLTPVQSFTQGITYPITLRQVTSGNYFFAAYFNVFIDYNRDGNFDPVTERVFSGGPTGPTSLTPVTTFVNGNITIPFSSFLGTTRMRIVLREGGNNTNPPCGTYAWGETEDYLINIVAGTPCGLTNAGTATTSLSNVCPLQVFKLDITGTVTLGSGMTWQWQSSTTGAGGPWTNIPGANYYPFATTQGVTTWYRCQITCGATNLFTVPVQVTQNSATQCYCIPIHIPNCNNMWTSNVTFNTLNNSTGCSSNTGLAYNVYPAVGTSTTTVTQNQTYNISVTTSGIINSIISVWIDYNYNGVYEPTEWQQIAVSNPPGSTATVPVTIPGTSGTGLTGMRVRSRFAGNPNNANSACITFGSGETEDYFITINPFIPPACSGTPGPFTAFASATTICSGMLVNFTLNPNASTIFAGLTYQWQSAPALVGPWTNIVGATNKIYSNNINTTEYYRCIVTCSNSGLSSTSTPVLVTVQPATWLGFTDDWNDPTNWCGRVPTLVDDALISLLASGRPAASYFFPVVAVGDTMRARNLTIASTDSVTVLTDTTVLMTIAQSINNNGKMAIVTSKADSTTFGTSAIVSGLIQAFKGGSATDNIVQVIYTVSELQAAGMLAGDVIDSIYLKFNVRGSTAAYQNFAISYALLPLAQDQFVANDPLLGVTTVYANPALIIGTPTNGIYTAISASSGVLKLPLNNMIWDGVSNILLQICYDMTAGSPGGSDQMFLTSTAPRKSCLWLGSSTIATSGCSLTSLSPGLQPSFGQVPSTFRPNIGFRFRRAQNRLIGTIGGDMNINAGAKFWSSFAGLTITGNINNASFLYADTTNIDLLGLFVNTGTADFSYTPSLSNRKSFLQFFGSAWTNNGTFISGNSRVSFAGASPQTIGGVNSTSFHEFYLNKGAASQTVTMQKDITVSDSLIIGTGQLLMNKFQINVTNSAFSAVTRPATTGFIISEDSLSKFNWTINTVVGYRSIPFGHAAIAAPIYIPYSLFLNSGDMGIFSISTYATSAALLPWPPSVTHINNVVPGSNNSANMAKRFWLISKTGANPVSNLTFRFTSTERPVGMSIVNQGRAQPWRVNGSNAAWIRLQMPSTSSTYTQTYTQVAAASHDSVRIQNFDWPILPVLGGAPFPHPLGNSNPWAIASNNTPLPVELLHFDAVPFDSRVRINWSTASETESDYFTVQRTIDFVTHQSIAKIQAAGFSSVLQSYEAWDNEPFKGVNYYRLLQTDFDGTENVISDYVPVKFGGDLKFEILTMLSEPSSELLFNYNSDQDVQLELYDITGRVVYTVQAIRAQPGMNIVPLDLNSLSSGIYTIHLHNSVAAASYRFMKQ